MTSSGLYLRPAGILHGAAAHQAVAEGQALALAGGPLAFSHCVVIEGEPGRTRRRIRAACDIAASSEAALHALLRQICSPRPAIAGLDLSRPRIMGIVNVTPDSFSDPGVNSDRDTAIASGRAMAAAGADILDIGGESTRPGSKAVPYEEEKARVLPVVSALAGIGPPISIDTRKAAIMREAVAAGACIINDVSALAWDAQARQAAAQTGACVVLMHARADPQTMQDNTDYADVVLEVYDALAGRIAAAENAGVARARIIVDPGIGFGKSFEQNLELLENLSILHGLGVPLLAGVSRKGFIGHVTGVKVAARRVPGSLAAALAAASQGAHILRVHDVAETRQALDMWCAAMGLAGHIPAPDNATVAYNK